MFFKKNQPLREPAPRDYSWPKKDARTQRLWVLVNQWDYIVSPSLKHKAAASWSFQFKGHSVTEPLEGLLLTGAIELAQLPHPPAMLKYHWGNVAENVEGYLFMMNAVDPAMPPSLGATLYCQSEGFENICRAFSLGVQGGHGSLAIEMQIDHPGEARDDFWGQPWRNEWLRVVSWKVHAGARLGN